MVDREHSSQPGLLGGPESGEKAADPPWVDDSVSLVEIASVILRRRGLVLRSVVVFTGIALAMALTKPTLYTSSASFIPESSASTPSGALSLARQFGIGLPGGGAERSPQFYAGLVTSTEILREVVTERYRLSPIEGGPQEMDLITYFEADEVTIDVGIERTIEALNKHLVVDVDFDTGVVRFSVTTTDPMLSQGVAATILSLVNDFDLTTRQSQASAEREFSGARLAELTAEFQEAEDSLKNFLQENRLFSTSPSLQFEHDRLQRAVMMRQEFVTSLTQAFENARIEEVRNTPVITLVESPRAPAIRDRKGRVLLMFLGVLSGGMVGVFLAFVKNYFEAEKRGQRPRLDEFSSLWREALADVTRFLPFRRSAR